MLIFQALAPNLSIICADKVFSAFCGVDPCQYDFLVQIFVSLLLQYSITVSFEAKPFICF